MLCFSKPFLETCLWRQLGGTGLGNGGGGHLGRGLWRRRIERGDDGEEIVDARGTAMGILLLRLIGVLDRRLREGTIAILLVREVVDSAERG